MVNSHKSKTLISEDYWTCKMLGTEYSVLAWVACEETQFRQRKQCAAELLKRYIRYSR